MKIPRNSFKRAALYEITDAIDSVQTLLDFDFDDSVSTELSKVLSYLDSAFTVLRNLKID